MCQGILKSANLLNKQGFDDSQSHRTVFFLWNFRLGLDIPGLFGLTTTTIDSVLIPTKVRSIKSRVMDIAMGPNHTVLLTDEGKVKILDHK